MSVDGPEEPLEIVKNLRGVVHAFYLSEDILSKMKEEEAKVRAAGGSGRLRNRPSH